MSQKKHYQLPSLWETTICIFSFFLFYQINKTDKLPLLESNVQEAGVIKLQVLPILDPGQVEGTFQQIVIRNFTKTTIQKAALYPSLRDSYFSVLVLKNSLIKQPENYFRRLFNSSIFSNAP